MALPRLATSLRFRSRRLVRQTKHAIQTVTHRLRPGYKPTGERVCPDYPDANFVSHLGVYEFVAQFAEGCDVLDAGCGAGYGCSTLAEAGASSVVGIDCARDAIRFATKRYRDRATFRRMDAQLLMFPAASFDLVVSSENLEHLRDPEAFIREARRVLRSDGLLVVGTPNKEMSSPGMEVPSNPFHVKEFYFSELDALLRQHFASVVIFENTEISASELGRRMQRDRLAGGSCGLIVGEQPSITVDGHVIELHHLHNTHSFLALAWRPRADIPQAAPSADHGA